jgi:hypothetical protein
MFYKIAQKKFFFPLQLFSMSNKKSSKKKSNLGKLNHKIKKKRCENVYFVFDNLTKKTLNHYKLLKPRKQKQEISKFWNFIDNKLKNQFYEFTNRKRILEEINIEGVADLEKVINHNQPENSSQLRIIIDDRSPGSDYNRALSSVSAEYEYKRNFNEWIDPAKFAE